MRVLITGAGGFVGRHLARHLAGEGSPVKLHGTLHTAEDAARAFDVPITLHRIDLRDERATADLLAAVAPDQIYHLAGQAFVQRSFEAPWETLEINIRAQLNVLHAALKLEPRPRIVVISSAEVYGLATQMPIREDAPFMPVSPYAVSKVAQDQLGLQYFLAHDLPVIRARAFNHIGPGQDERFVAPAFASQIARIEAGQQAPRLAVGNLTDQRDFTDVRDVVRAYALLMARGAPGEAYNVSSNRVHSVQWLVDTLLGLTPARIDVMVDPARLRLSRLPVLQGDNQRLMAATGWQPTIPLAESLRDILDDCRHKVSPTE